jgi:hypothetical protein
VKGKNTNWRAMQAAGAGKQKHKSVPLPRPSEVLPRYLTMGSWHANLSNDGKRG